MHNLFIPGDWLQLGSTWWNCNSGADAIPWHFCIPMVFRALCCKRARISDWSLLRSGVSRKPWIYLVTLKGLHPGSEIIFSSFRIWVSHCALNGTSNVAPGILQKVEADHSIPKRNQSCKCDPCPYSNSDSGGTPAHFALRGWERARFLPRRPCSHHRPPGSRPLPLWYGVR